MNKPNKKKARCKAINRNGNQCRNHALKNSKYCYRHNFGNIRGVVFYKNPTVHLIFSCLSVLIAVLAILISECNSNSNAKRLREWMVILDSSNNAKYLQKYPKGYAIFGTFDKNIIIPGKSNLLQDYDIIWDDAAIMKYDEKTIQIMLPSFIYKPNRVSVNGNTIAIPRYKKDLSYKTIDFSPDEILIELIFDNGNILIFVIGVRARDPEIWEKRSDLHHIVTHPIWCDV